MLAKLKSERRHSSYGATEGSSPLEMKPDSSEDLTGTDAATLPLRIHDQVGLRAYDLGSRMVPFSVHRWFCAERGLVIYCPAHCPTNYSIVLSLYRR